MCSLLQGLIASQPWTQWPACRHGPASSPDSASGFPVALSLPAGATSVHGQAAARLLPLQAPTLRHGAPITSPCCMLERGWGNSQLLTALFTWKLLGTAICNECIDAFVESRCKWNASSGQLASLYGRSWAWSGCNDAAGHTCTVENMAKVAKACKWKIRGRSMVCCCTMCISMSGALPRVEGCAQM